MASSVQAELIREHRSVDDDRGDVNFETIFEPKTKFKVDFHSYPKLMTEYCDQIAIKKQFDMSETVKRGSGIPLIGHFVIKFEDEHGDGEIYKECFLEHLVDIYRDTIAEVYSISEDQREEACIITEHILLPDSGETTILDLRIQFPMVIVKSSAYENTFKPALIKKFRSHRLLQDFILEPVGDWTDFLVDFKTHVPLFGSKWHEEIPASTEVYYFGLEAKDYNIYDHSIFKNYASRDVFKNEPKFWLPIYLSIHYYTILAVEKKVEKKRAVEDYDFQVTQEDNPRDIFNDLIRLVTPNRVQSTTDWKIIGEIFCKTFEDQKSRQINPCESLGFKMFAEWSSRFGKTLYECEQFWIDINPTKIRYSVRRLAEYIREDSPAMYKRWHDEWSKSAFAQAIDSPSDENYAKSFYRFFWLDLIYAVSDGSKGRWYEFNNIRLVQQAKECIMQKIGQDYANVYKRNLLMLTQKSLNGGLSSFEERENNDCIKKIAIINTNLQKINTKKKIIEGASYYFIDTNFYRFKDQNDHLLGTQNCILEVRDDKVVPRAGYIEDYITFSTQVPYNQGFTDDHPIIKKVNEIINQLMCYDDQLVKRLHMLNASVLRGKNLDKYFNVAPGEGNNGKTVYFKLMRSGLGDYYVVWPVEILTEKSGSSSRARPEIVQADGARMVTISEPGREAIDSNAVKRHTGNDDLWCRGLFKDGGLMEQRYKLFFTCNIMPDIEGTDKAAIDRTNFIPFMATFVDHPPASREEQISKKLFLKDPNLEDQVSSYGAAMLWLMVKWYPVYCKVGLKSNVPEIVSEYTDRYWDDRDQYMGFIRDALIMNGEPDNEVSRAELYKSYKIWHRTERSSGKMPTSSDFYSYIKDAKRLGEPSKKHIWSGITIRDSFKEDS